MLDVDVRVDERRGDPLGEVLEGVGDFGAVLGGERDVVEFVDFTDCRSSNTGSELRRFINYMSVTATWGRCCRSSG